MFAFAFKQNEKAIKYNQDIYKLEKEKLKEQCRRDELDKKKRKNSNKIKNILNMSRIKKKKMIESKISKRARRMD